MKPVLFTEIHIQLSVGKLTLVVILVLWAITQVSAQGSGTSTTAINITEFSFTPSTVDTTNSSQTVTVTVHVTDSERDVRYVSINFRSPRNGRYEFDLSDRISGNARDGVYRKAVTFYQYAEAGTWEVSYIHVLDGTTDYYRYRELYTSELIARGFATQVQVINNNETIPPEISDFSFTPAAINAVDGPRNVTITLRAKDETSGVSSIYVSFTNPPGCYYYDDDCATLLYVSLTGADRISGDDKDGVYRVVVTVPQQYPLGIYSASVTAVDVVQNYASLNPAELAARGYPYQLRIFGTAGLTVTRSDDRNAVCLPDDCSLREAVNAVNSAPTDDTINFASGLTTITLTNELVINNAGALTISGPGANVLSIDGGAGTNRIFSINQTTVTISGMTLTGGNSSNSGGAIYDELGSLTLNGVHVKGNSAAFGGGVYFNGGAHRIVNSTLSANNGSDEGGAIRNSGASLMIVNSTISGNTSYNAGGIFNENGALTLRNSTITNNSNGGITADRGTVNFGNTIVAGNINTVSPGYANEFNCYCAITSAGSNLVGDSPGDSTSTGLVSIVYQPTDIRDTNPLLGPLQNNGGATPTHALLAGSPAIDKGINRLVSPIAPAFDQRGAGFARIRDGNGDGRPTVDIGAFEVQLGSIGSRPTPFDYDGDGRSDVSVWRPSSGTWFVNQSTDGFRAMTWGVDSDKLVPADYDGDGKSDIAVWRPSTGTWYFFKSATNSFSAQSWGEPGDIPAPADFDGDGLADLTVFRPSTGVWYRINSTDNSFNILSYGQNDDRPVIADYDGDGRADLAVFRPSNGRWYIQRTTAGYFVQALGSATTPLVPADYDGDGRTDIAIFSPSTGYWYIYNWDSGSLAAIGPLGQTGDIRVPADYDGDGKADLAVFRPSNGTWYIDGSMAGISEQAFGESDDVPTETAFSH